MKAKTDHLEVTFFFCLCVRAFQLKQITMIVSDQTRKFWDSTNWKWSSLRLSLLFWLGLLPFFCFLLKRMKMEKENKSEVLCKNKSSSSWSSLQIFLSSVALSCAHNVAMQAIGGLWPSCFVSSSRVDLLGFLSMFYLP